MPVFRPYPVMTVATLAALLILVSLGNWQMRRLAWKEDLIASVEARVDQPPIGLHAALVASDEGDISYTPVTVTGIFYHEREVQVFGQNLDGVPGYFIYTPLTPRNLPTVIVNRGFVPQELKDPAMRPEGQMEAVAVVTGLARSSREAGPFQPANDPASGAWYVANLNEMAAAMDRTNVAPFFVDADASPNPGGWPLGGQTIIAFRNSHLGYALTWYGLALTLLGVYVAVHIGAGRLALRRSSQ